MPAMNGLAVNTTSRPSIERERRRPAARPPQVRRTGSAGVRAAAGRAAPPPARRTTRGVVGSCAGSCRSADLEGALECRDQDQDVEPVPPHEAMRACSHEERTPGAPPAASYLGRSPDRRLVRARTRPPDDVGSPPGVHRRCIEPNDERNVMETRTTTIPRARRASSLSCSSHSRWRRSPTSASHLMPARSRCPQARTPAS